MDGPTPRPVTLSSPTAALPQLGDASWHALATAAAAEFKDQLAAPHYLRLRERDRTRLARRLHEAIETALTVPPELPAALAAEMARRLRRAAPDTAREPLAWQRVREHARHAAAIGAVTTLPATLSGLGTALAALGLVADWRHVAEHHRDLILELAALLGVPLEEPTRQVRALFVAGATAMLAEAAPPEVVVHHLASHVAQRSVARVTPGAGTVMASSLNYLATMAIGRATLLRFAAHTDCPVGALFPRRRHPSLPRLEQAVISAIHTAELGREVADPFADARLGRMLRDLAATERQELLELAAVSAVAQGGISPAEQRVLDSIAARLGYSEATMHTAIVEVRAAIAAFSPRFRALLDSTRETTVGVTRVVWRRTRELARGG